MDVPQVGDRIFYNGKDWTVKEIHDAYIEVINPKNEPLGGGRIYRIYFDKIRMIEKDQDGRDVVYI